MEEGLFVNGDVTKPKAPKVGMVVGEGIYSDTNIGMWVKQYCMGENKGYKLSKECGAYRKVFICSDLSGCCNWKLCIGRGNKNKTKWYVLCTIILYHYYGTTIIVISLRFSL